MISIEQKTCQNIEDSQVHWYASRFLLGKICAYFVETNSTAFQCALFCIIIASRLEK